MGGRIALVALLRLVVVLVLTYLDGKHSPPGMLSNASKSSIHLGQG